MEEILQILEYEISVYQSKKENLENLKTTQDLYSEVLSHSNSIDEILENKENILILLNFIDNNSYTMLLKKITLIETLRRKKLTEYKEYESAVNIINKIFSNLKIEYEKINLQVSEEEKLINNNQTRISIFKNIISRVKYNQFIPYKFVNYLNSFFEEKNLNILKQIKYLELLNIYNKTIYEKIHNMPNSYKNDVLDMLSFGFEKIEENDIDYNSEIAKKVELHYSLLDYYNDFDQYFNDLNQEISDHNDLKLFYILMIKKIQSEIMNLISLIKDKDFYVDKTLKQEIIKDYQKVITRYVNFRNQYFNIIKKDDDLAIKNEAKIIFAQDSNGKPYFLKDLKSVNKEYLGKVLELIESLKDGTLTNKIIEGFTSRYKDFRKLKYDQIRIVIHPINHSLYCIMGVGVKKENSGEALYKTLCGRKYPTDGTKYEDYIKDGEQTLNCVVDYINENKRKGNR